jgi:hypothetical protein
VFFVFFVPFVVTLPAVRKRTLRIAVERKKGGFETRPYVLCG